MRKNKSGMDMNAAAQSDKMILELAFYDVTKGHQIDWKVRNQNEYNEMLRLADKRFAEFKRLLIAKETSWPQLSGDVYKKYAVDLREYFHSAPPAVPAEKEPKIYGFNPDPIPKKKIEPNNG